MIIEFCIDWEIEIFIGGINCICFIIGNCGYNDWKYLLILLIVKL